MVHFDNVRSAVASLVLLVGAFGACGSDAPPTAVPANATNGRIGSPELQPTATSTPAPTYGPQSPMIPGTGAEPTASSTKESDTPHPHFDPSGSASGLGASGAKMPIDLSGLDDARLAGIVQAIQRAESQHLQLASSRASSADVLGFARDGLDSDRSGTSLDQSTFGQLKLTPTPSALSDQVQEDWQQDLTALQNAPATEFDRVFVDHEVALGMKAVTLIDSAIPVCRSTVLGERLRSDRASIAEHVQQAVALQKALRSQVQ